MHFSQGGGEAPRCLSAKLTTGIWWVFCFQLVQLYCANLAAFLTLEALETPIKSLEELTKQYQNDFAPVKESATEQYFWRRHNIEEMYYK